MRNNTIDDHQNQQSLIGTAGDQAIDYASAKISQDSYGKGINALDDSIVENVAMENELSTPYEKSVSEKLGSIYETG